MFQLPSRHIYQIYLIIYKHADIWVGADNWGVHPTRSSNAETNKINTIS